MHVNISVAEEDRDVGLDSAEGTCAEFEASGVAAFGDVQAVGPGDTELDGRLDDGARMKRV